MEVTYTYDRVHLDCTPDGDTCQSGYVSPGGWYAPTKGDCPREVEVYPIDTDWGHPQEVEAQEVEAQVRDMLGAIDEVGIISDGKLRAYSADNCACPTADYEESRAAHITGDRRLIRVLAHRLGK